ncbi:hypothetical protein INT45_013147 [Circinella minor]|uniref:F-box domain-containing protein n=1 Tax=Circinella minor TaxID=1195481 RepID=A0A8H7S656_9FUNG|nr:hypothetical protein INT45_013147 [Circinella minor]
MPIPALPTEVIILIISYLPRPHIVRLLTVNRHWYNVISAQLYRTLCIRSLREQYEYRNLFNETRRGRKRRQQQQKSSNDQQQQQQSTDSNLDNKFEIGYPITGNGNGFYSSENYGQYVRVLDLSVPYNGKDITDSFLYDLALDCPNIETLNLYNCHKITTGAVKRVLAKCKRIRFFYLSMATSLDARCLQEAIPGQLHTLNIFGVPRFFFRHRPKAVLASLKTLKAGQWLDRQTIDLTGRLEHISLEGMHPEHISHLMQCNKNLRTIRLVRCQIHPILLGHLTNQKQLTTLELHRCKFIFNNNDDVQCDDYADGGSVEGDNMLLHFSRYHLMQRLEFKYMHIPSIQRIVEKCSDRLVSFIGPYNLSDAILDTLSTYCCRLERLSLVTRSNDTSSGASTSTSNTSIKNNSGRVHISLESLKRTLHTYTSSLAHLELSIQPATIVEQALLQWPNPNLQILILRLRVSISLLQSLATLYPALRVLYIASTESISEDEVDQYLLGQGKLEHLEALMLYDRRDSTNQEYLTLKNHYDYWSLGKEIW